MKTTDTAIISPRATIGRGTRIWHHTQIRENVRIGENCIIGKGVYIDAGVQIGRNCKIQNGVYLYAPAWLEDSVFIGPGAMTTNDKCPRAVTPAGTLKGEDDWKKAGCRIREGASIGAGSLLLPGIEIGCWAMVGAGSVVTIDVPPHALVVGHPARLAGYVCRCGAKVQPYHGLRQCPTCREILSLPEAVDPYSIVETA